MDKVKDKVRELTRRNSPKSTEETVRRMNQTLKGWFNYFRASSGYSLAGLDGWIRRRLRSLFRRRTHRRGISGGREDNQRWPNAYFESIGLFSTEHAQRVYIQSLKGAL